MKITLFFLSLLCLFWSNVFSQDSLTCGTAPGYTASDTLDVPWYGDNDYLYRILDQRQEHLINPVERSGMDCVEEISSAIFAPVKFWVWEDFAGESEVTQEQLQSLIDALTDAFMANGMNIRFFMKCPEFLVDFGNTDITSSAELHQLNSNDMGAEDDQAINIHIVRTGSSGDVDWAGVYSGGPFNDFIAIRRSLFTGNDVFPQTIVHEGDIILG